MHTLVTARRLRLDLPKSGLGTVEMNIHESVRILAQIPFTVADPLVRFVSTCYPSCVAFDLIPGKCPYATQALTVLKEMLSRSLN